MMNNNSIVKIQNAYTHGTKNTTLVLPDAQTLFHFKNVFPFVSWNVFHVNDHRFELDERTVAK